MDIQVQTPVEVQRVKLLDRIDRLVYRIEANTANHIQSRDAYERLLDMANTRTIPEEKEYYKKLADKYPYEIEYYRNKVQVSRAELLRLTHHLTQNTTDFPEI